MSEHDFDVTVPAALEGARADVAVILGSGLGAVADSVGDAVVYPYGEIDGFPSRPGRVLGHADRLVLGSIEGTSVAVFQGRLHLYQGISARDAAYPARLAAALGAHTLVVTNAAGGLSPQMAPGDLMSITDHINLMGQNPLTGWPGPEGGTPFVPMTDAYDPELLDIATSVARERDVRLHRGVYVAVSGPSYETPAEVAMLGEMGAQAVGMSTVPEVIAARAQGMRVLGLSLITNVAASHGLSHDEVLEIGAAASVDLAGLLVAILGRLE